MAGPYVTPEDLTGILGPGADTERVATACAAATDWIDAVTGTSWVLGDDPAPLRVRQLALNASARFYHDPEAPYGVIAASSDVPMYMRRLMVDAEPLLLGLRRGFGIG